MIIFTPHSLLKLKQRKISKKLIIKTLKNPDNVLKSYAGRKIADKKFDHRYLKVIFKTEKQNSIVITQYWTKEVK